MRSERVQLFNSNRSLEQEPESKPRGPRRLVKLRRPVSNIAAVSLRIYPRNDRCVERTARQAVRIRNLAAAGDRRCIDRSCARIHRRINTGHGLLIPQVKEIQIDRDRITAFFSKFEPMRNIEICLRIGRTSAKVASFVKDLRRYGRSTKYRRRQRRS